MNTPGGKAAISRTVSQCFVWTVLSQVSQSQLKNVQIFKKHYKVHILNNTVNNSNLLFYVFVVLMVSYDINYVLYM